MEGMNPDTVHYIVFNPTQVKSATGNRGTFNPVKAEIDESNDGLGPLTPAQEAALGHVRNVHKKPTWKERKDAAFTNLGLRLNQAIVDQFAPIKDYGPIAYLLARLSKGSDGAFEAFLTYGNLYLDRDGVTNARVGMPSFFKNMSALQGQHIRFLWWVAAHRAEQLTAEQRENLFGTTDIAELKKLDEGDLPDGSSRAQAFNVALQQYNAMNRQVLDIAEQSGIINRESRAIWEKEFYVPFYRALENDKADVGANIASGARLIRQQAFRKLKGGKNKINEDLMANVLMNWSHLISASAKNRAAIAIFKEAETRGTVVRYPTKHSAPQDAVWAVENGDKVYYEVHDPYLLDAITGLNDQSVGGAAGEALAKMKHILTVGVTANPAFKVRNILRDSIQSIAISGIGLNVFSNVSQGVKELANKDSQVRASMLAGGGLIRFGSMLEGNRSRHVEKLVNAGVADQTILDTKEKVADFAQKMWDKYNDIGDISEGANRAALYMKMIKEGKSHAEASLAARDLLDFSKGGTSNAVRFLTQSVPFLNARIQGTYRVYQGAKEDPMRFWTSVMAVAVASAALMLAYQDDDDWKKREEWDRDNYWWFKDGDTAYRIPKPFEVGAIATLAERTLEYLINDEMTGKRLAERFKFALANTFAANPTPQMFKPIVDIYSNVDSFTGRRIESFGMEQRPKSERAASSTSELAKGLGPVTGLFNVSPVQLDHLIRGWFGWIGASALVASDAVARPMLDRAERPSKKLDDLFLVGNFAKELPASQSRYVTQFYDQAEEIRQAYNSYRDKLKIGDKEGAVEQLTKNPQIKLQSIVSGVEHQMSEINAAVRKIEASRTLDADAKRTRISLLYAKRNALAEKAVRVMNR
jgi:hypothetical protein